MLVDVIKSVANRIYSVSTKVLPGGYSLKDSHVSIGKTIEKGTLICVDGHEARLCGAGIALTGSTTTAVKVGKCHGFSVGDVVLKEGTSDSATISAIDSTTEGYDTLTLDAAITGLVANDVLVSSVAPKPNAVTASDVIVGESTTLDVACEAIVYAHNYVLPASWRTNTKLCLSENHGIVFI